MKDFRFRLQRVLDWQSEQCELIENRVKSLCRELGQIQARMAGAQADLVAAEEQVLGAHRLDGASLNGLAAYRISLRKRMDSLNAERQGCEMRLAATARPVDRGSQALSHTWRDCATGS